MRRPRCGGVFFCLSPAVPGCGNFTPTLSRRYNGFPPMSKAPPLSDVRNTDIRNLFSPTVLEEARRLVANRRLWGFSMTSTRIDGASPPSDNFRASALVLADDREPMRISFNSGSMEFTCECGAADCIHGAALLVKLTEECPGDNRFDGLRISAGTAGPPVRGIDTQQELFSLDAPIFHESSQAPRAHQAAQRDGARRNSTEESGERQTGQNAKGNRNNHSRTVEHAAQTGATGKSAGEKAPGLSPETDLLFFTEPVHLEKRAVTVLGRRTEIAEALAPRPPARPIRSPGSGIQTTTPKNRLNSAAGPSVSSGTAESGSAEIQGNLEPAEARFKDLRGGEWAIRPAVVSIRKDGEYSPPRPWSDDGLAEPDFPGSDEIRSTLAEYIGAGDDFLTPAGLKWRYLPAQALRFRFDPLLSAGNDDPLYEPVAELICSPESSAETDSGSIGLPEQTDPPAAGPTTGPESEQSPVRMPDSAGEREFPAGIGVSGAAVISGSGLLILDEDQALAAHLEDLGESLWFVRLMLSRRVMSASDLKARLTGRRRPPKNILIELPDLPDTLEVLNPVLVLEITSRESGTDLIPRWRYGPVILDGRGRSDVVMDQSSIRPRPIGLRNRNAEAVVLDRAEEILGPALAWRRGRYSRLSGDPNIPLRLDSSLQDVLAEFGSALMDEGVELRLEDRPVRRNGSLSVRAGRRGRDLEMNAVVTVPESDREMDEVAELELDSWLGNGGLVRTRSAYFTLTGKALDQLNFLRDHGMEDSGFLTTSPDNLSLIDAVYSEIESDEDTAEDLERRRAAYARLTGDRDKEADEAAEPPEEFQAQLRPYQLQGYAWLLRLHKEGLGGCLADDMGLGKTVQTLAYLSRLHTDGRLGASLLVGPVVTLGNWEAEIRRFAPNLSLHRYAGPADKRILPEENEGVQLIVVSYQTLRNDVEKFLNREWDHIILDEAHYVKNAASRTFKAIRSLNAQHRVSLTGTPLENHLDDLWSQMSFLNPGLLGSRSRFADRYVRPVEEGEGAGEKSAVSRLADTVAPFILRRRKSEVLTELPPKDESIIRCEMTEEQASAYESMRGLYQRQVSGLLSRDGLAGARIEIFTIISKLRLLAIHPPLAGESFAGIEGGKMSAMDRLLEEIMEEDHKTLVFSQFLGALDRAEAVCRKNGWGFSRLTGSTKNREEPIRRFNEEAERRIFLLSLKAGGVGINLTAADYVMLLDPWWNPAVEAQAVDRAHRMGQTRPVMVYRLITEGTIEERVLMLQQQKRDLIAGVLGDTDAPALSEKEILNLFE